MNVEAWLAKLGMEQYAEAFAENGVDAGLIAELTNEDLKDLGVARLADRKLLLKAIAGVSQPEPDPAAGVPSTVGERRQVTVLFADLADFTGLSSELGAEETHALLNQYFEVVDSIVESYGGSIDKHIGDNVMGVFGAPVAHGDDPLRAVRAAFDIHERLAALSQTTGRSLSAHIGIASGQVVASGTGSDAHSEYTVTGNSVNLASRLQDKATSGETLISEEVHKIVEEQIDCESVGELPVKGFAEPIKAWRAKFRRSEDHAAAGTPFAGRRAELGQFASIIKTCRSNGAGQAIAVRGEAGIGKTRLVEEFTRTAVASKFTIHRGLVFDFGTGQGRDAIRSIAASLIGVQTGCNSHVMNEALDAAVKSRRLLLERRIFLNALFDLEQSLADRARYDAMDSEARKEGERTALAGLVSSASQAGPLMIIIEDIHWADPSAIAHLAEIAKTTTKCPALLIMTSRAENYPLGQAWRSATDGCSVMIFDLEPLGRDDAIEMAGAYIDTSDELAQNCVERADGNPLFLKQLLRNLEELGEGEIPASIQSLVLARIDRLQLKDKQALQAASVLGQRFGLDALRHLIGDTAYTCERLIERSLVRPEADEFLFDHALVQEGVYGSLLSERRKDMHTRAADWYVGQDPVLRASHLDRAGDPEAAAAYLEAARPNVAALQFETTLRLAARGIELVEDPDDKCDLLCLRGDALRNTGETEASIEVFEAALEAAQDDVRRCRSWIGQAAGLRVSDKHERALAVLEKAKAPAASNNLLLESAEIYALRGSVLFPLSRFEDCLAAHKKSLSFARDAGSNEGIARAFSGLGDAYYLKGHMRSATEQFRACLDVCREHGLGRIEVNNLNMVGWSRIHLMQFDGALKDAEDTIEMASQVRQHRAELLGLMLAGLTKTFRGEFDQATVYSHRSIELSRRLGASNFEAQTYYTLAQISLAQGQKEQAREYAALAEEIVRNVGMTFIGPTVLAIRAQSLDDPQESRKLLREAEDILDKGCVAHNHLSVARAAINYSLAEGQWDEAERYATRLEAFISSQPVEWPEYEIARARALATWGRGDRTEANSDEIKRLHALAVKTNLQLLLPSLEVAF